MNRSRQEALRRHFQTVATSHGSEEGLEAVGEDGKLLEAIERDGSASDKEKEDARGALDQLRKNEELTSPQSDALEAIILPKERPVVFVQDDKFEAPGWPFEHLDRPEFRRPIDAAIPFIGRIELPNSPLPYGGTGFVVGDGVLMTNRHVAGLFATGLGSRESDLSDRASRRDRLQARARARCHAHVPRQESADDPSLLGRGAPRRGGARLGTGFAEALDQEPAGNSSDATSPSSAIPRSTRETSPSPESPLQERLQRQTMQPGKLRGREDTESFGHIVSAIAHDSSTLGGNSGSAVIDVATGEVVALHFAGIYLKANYGVPSYELARDSRVVDAGLAFTGSIGTGRTPWDDAWTNIEATPEPPRGTQRLAVGAGSTWTIPLEVTVRVGSADQVSVGAGGPTDSVPSSVWSSRSATSPTMAGRDTTSASSASVCGCRRFNTPRWPRSSTTER